MSDHIENIEFQIGRMSVGRFETVLHIYRPDGGWRVEARVYVSERETHELDQRPAGALQLRGA